MKNAIKAPMKERTARKNRKKRYTFWGRARVLIWNPRKKRARRMINNRETDKMPRTRKM